jgi:Spy/CpxP family protein refolding chaperone
MRIRTWLTIVGMSAALLVAASASAQPREGRGPRGPQLDNPPFERVATRVIENVDLTDEQIVQIEELVAAHEATWEEHVAHFQEVMGLVREMRAAHQAGDNETAAGLREQLRTFREQPRPHELFLDDVESIMTPEQLEQFAQLDWQRPGRGERRGGRGPRGLNPERVKSVLTERLALTEDQQRLLDDLLAETQADMAAAREMIAAHRDLRRQIRDAEAAGDTALAEELRAELAELPRPEQRPMAAFVEGLKGMLSEEQLGDFEQLAERMRGRGRDGQARGQRNRGGQGVRLLQALRELELTAEQQTEVRAVMRAHQADRPGRNATREERRAHLQELKDKLATVLTAEQMAELETLLSEDRPETRQDRFRERLEQRGERPQRRG